MSIRKSDSGQTLMFVAIAMPVMLGFLGLGIDMGYMRYTRRQVQMAADAAAIAAANEAESCLGLTNCALYETTAEAAVATDNSFPNVTAYLNGSGNGKGNSACTATPGSGDTVVLVNNPPQCVVNDPNQNNHYVVEAIVSENVPTLFGRVLGMGSVTVTARAEAGLPGGGNCVYTFGKNPSNGSSENGITLVLGVFQSPCGVVDESTEPDGFFSGAFYCLAGSFTAPYIGVVGGAENLLCNTSSITSGITTPQPADPLAYRQTSMEAAAPPPSTCGTTPSGKSFSGSNKEVQVGLGTSLGVGNFTFSPGTYCGGISIGPGANVTFSPGIYTLTGNGLAITVGANVAGTGVAFYDSNYNSAGQQVAGYANDGGINFLCSSCTLGTVNLSAPTSGAYEGVLFFQNPYNTASSTIVGSAAFNNTLTGLSYLPSASVTYAFDFDPTSGYNGYNGIVADTITYGLTWNGTNLNTYNYNNYSTLADGNPLKGTGGVLVE
jgi:Flp pilus assembly protein TadG